MSVDIHNTNTQDKATHVTGLYIHPEGATGHDNSFIVLIVFHQIYNGLGHVWCKLTMVST